MADIFFVHWNEDESKARVAPLVAAGHRVRCHWSTQETASIGPELPEALIISLDRLPSHGRAIAEWFWEAKKRQSIPLIFAGGKPEKVEAAARQFPRAVFCATDDMPKVLKKLFG